MAKGIKVTTYTDASDVLSVVITVPLTMVQDSMEPVGLSPMEVVKWLLEKFLEEQNQENKV